MLREFELGAEATAFIKERLSSFGLSFSSHILAALRLEDGHVVTHLPPDAPIERIKEFQWGGVSNTIATYNHAANFIVEYLQSSDRAYAIFEEVLGRTNHPYMQLEMRQWFCYGTEIYFFHSSYAENLDTVGYSLRKAGGRPGIIMLTFLPEDESHFVNHQTVTEVLLTKLAERTVHVLTDAYDDEAWLIWSRLGDKGNAGVEQ